MRRTLSLMALAAFCGCAQASTASMPVPYAGSLNFRMVRPPHADPVAPADLLASLAQADVIFVGEQHDDAETHRAEAELLSAIGRMGRPVILSLEMFERDVQPVLDDYLAERISEEQFLARSRPWPGYSSSYRRLVELAKGNHWPIVAADVPRPMASAVGKSGLAALDKLDPKERQWAAMENVCPLDDYHARFVESMQGHSAGGAAPSPGDTLPTVVAERFYLAQCVKDETMAESIVAARRAGPANAIVVHFDGAFHSDYFQGTVMRVQRREPSWKLKVITAVPVADPLIAPVAPHAGQADVILFTRHHADP